MGTKTSLRRSKTIFSRTPSNGWLRSTPPRTNPGLAAGYISWSEVKALKPISLTKHKTKFIAVILKDPNAYLERQQNALKRKAMLINLRKYGSPVQLNPFNLRCTFDELLAHLQAYFDRSRPSVLN